MTSRRPVQVTAASWLCIILSASTVAAARPPLSWDKSPSPEFLARLRMDWFLPRPPSLLAHGGEQLREAPVHKCGKRAPWKESGQKISEVEQFLGNYVSRQAISRYEPIRILGHGSQGVVILAKDKLKEKLVAIKEERPGTLAREVRMMHAVRNSDDIMKVEDVLMPKHISGMTTAFAVYERLVLPVDQMHRMWGRGLAHSVPSQAMKRILFNIVRGVHFLHTNNIVHLDLKPDNVMLDEHCAPRIVDLGIAKLLCDENGQEIPVKAFHLKHGSRAPEFSGMGNSDLHRLRYGSDIAKASDLWSLGVVLLTTLHGGDVFWHYRKATGSTFEWTTDLLATMLGRPSERALKKYYTKDAYQRLMSFSKKPSMSLEEAFPHVDHAALAMVQRLMKMDPKSRASTRDVLLDPYFDEVRSAAFHEAALAEDLVADPRIPELIHTKHFSNLVPTVSAAKVIYELALAHSPDADAAAQTAHLNGTTAASFSEIR